VVVKGRRARIAGAAVAEEKRVRVVAGRRRKEARSLEAIVADVVRWRQDGRNRCLVWED
jgi:hypothetical protein